MPQQCERCGETSKLQTLLLALRLEDVPNGRIPKSITIHGAKLEVCNDCHDQWLASVQTWFESPSTTALKVVGE